jgi:hypothetical protein
VAFAEVGRSIQSCNPDMRDRGEAQDHPKLGAAALGAVAPPTKPKNGHLPVFSL